MADAAPAGLPAKFDDPTLLAAVKAYVVGGNVGAILGVTDEEVRHWTQSHQWNAMTARVMPEVKELLRGHLSRITFKAIGVLDTRIEQGDPVINLDGSPKLNEAGEQLYRPLKAKDLADIATKVMAETRALESRIGPIEDDEGKISLEKLAKGLARYANAKDIDGERV